MSTHILCSAVWSHDVFNDASCGLQMEKPNTPTRSLTGGIWFDQRRMNQKVKPHPVKTWFPTSWQTKPAWKPLLRLHPPLPKVISRKLKNKDKIRQKQFSCVAGEHAGEAAEKRSGRTQRNNNEQNEQVFTTNVIIPEETGSGFQIWYFSEHSGECSSSRRNNLKI